MCAKHKEYAIYLFDFQNMYFSKKKKKRFSKYVIILIF